MPRNDIDQSLHTDPERQFKGLTSAAVSGIKGHFPFTSGDRSLHLNRIWVDEGALDPNDLEGLKKARISGRSWTVPVYGDVSLTDGRTGRELGRSRRMTLAHLPRTTPHYSYLLDGTEYQIASQTRLRPGVYARIQQNGQLEGRVNLSKGLNFDARLDPETGRFFMEVGSARIPLYPVLKALGASDVEVADAWGKEIYEANRVPQDAEDAGVSRLYRVLKKSSPENAEEARKALREYYTDTELDPDVTRRTLGTGYSKVTPGLLLATSRKLLDVSRGRSEVDDRDALVFKEFYGPEDQLEYRLNHWKTTSAVNSQVQRRLKSRENPREIIGDAFDRQVKAFFARSSLSNATEQNNPANLIGEFAKVTSLGEGGIANTRAVPDESREMNDSHMSFLDPLHTPESSRIGVTLHSALDTRKEGKSLKTRLLDARTGREVWVSAQEVADAVVAFPDQFRTTRGGLRAQAPRVKVMKQGRMDEAPASQVDYAVPSPRGIFDASTNLIPFLGSTQGTRGMTGSKMSEQALPLVEREAPAVQVDYDGEKSFEEAIGEKFSVRSPVSGKIREVGKGHITIRARNGKDIRIPLHHDYPLNQKSFLNHEPAVKEGDTVRPGDLLADSNFTRGGALALGRNMRVAYMPYKGYTLEDASVVSESAARKLTSEHLHHVDVPVDDQSVLDIAKFKAHHPDVVTRDMEKQLDGKGVILPGARVKPGDLLVAHMRREDASPEDSILEKLSKSLVQPYKDRSAVWDHDQPGVVTDVVDLGNRMRVYVKTREPARVGDKIAGRYGNKSIISRILPDGEMPRLANGEAIDAIFDPHTVPSRINPSQLLESAAGRAVRARGAGKPFVYRNFSGQSALEKVRAMLREAGLPESGKETVVDPTTGDKIPGVFVGDHYLQKLKHQVEAKFSARSNQGYDINEAPKGGRMGAQSLDQLTLYSMLAHGGNRSLLREMATDYKASRNPELWRALQLGQVLPPPKPTFAFNKFLNLLQGMGVRVDRENDSYGLSPLTDDDVTALSGGPIRDPLKMIRGKDLKPEKGGLFDPDTTGGLRGTDWAHIDLAKRTPNPLLERGIQILSGITGNQFRDIMSGRLGVDEHGDLVDVP